MKSIDAVTPSWTTNMWITPVVPALIPKTKEDVRLFLADLPMIPEIHIDVTDGRLVSAISWPYNSDEQPAVIYDWCLPYTLEVDLMTEAPLPAAAAWLEAGADMLVFHSETISLAALTAFRETTDITIGVSALNSTPYEKLSPYLAVADYVQVMGIAAIGTQGQPFDPHSLERIDEIRREWPHLMISFDGSVNNESISTLKAKNINRYVIGSAITKSNSPSEAYQHYVSLLS